MHHSGGKQSNFINLELREEQILKILGLQKEHEDHLWVSNGGFDDKKKKILDKELV